MARTSIVSAGLVALVGLIAACSTTSPAAAPSDLPMPSTAASSSPATSADGGEDLLADLDVDGRKMHILCVGPTATNHPTVVFESGLGGDAGQWSDVLHELGGTYRACAYDRAGTGASEPASVGRTTKDQVADLRSLLEAADVRPPYVLVGFSVGGWNLMVHEDAHPDDVLGAVMVDVRPPAASQEWLKALPPESADESEAIKMAREEATVFDTDPTLNPEGLLLGDSSVQALETKGFGDRPLIVLAAADTAALSEGFEPALGTRMEAIWWNLQNELVSRSSKGQLVKVDDASHFIPIDRPDAVADAIREVIGD